MPAFIIGAIIAEVVAEAIIAPLVLGAIIGATEAMVIGGLVKFAVSGLVSNVLGGGDSGGSVSQDAAQAAISAPAVTSTRNRLLTIRQPVSPRQVVYGECRVGGIITFMSAQGADLHMVITLASHRSNAVGSIYFGDELVTFDSSGATRNGTGKWAGYLTVVVSLGDEGETQPFAGLVAATAGEWSSTHLQAGCTKLWVKLTANNDVYGGTVPNITAVVQGVCDVESGAGSPSTAAYRNNAALCAQHYLRNKQFGIGADADEFNEDTVAAAAAACDESVAIIGAGGTETRYAVNGAFLTTARPNDVLGAMLAAMAGKAVNIGGLWHLYAGVYSVPTLTFDEGDLAGPLRVQNMISRRDNANGIKGKFINPDAHWQPDDIPPIASDTFRNDDGGDRVWKELDLTPFVTRGSQAQRLEKMELLSLRQGLTVEALFKLTAWAAMTGCTVALNNTKYGWSAKPFDVIGARFQYSEDGTLGVALTLRETASSIYDWSTSEEQPVDAAPNTNLPDPFSGLDITGLTATSGTADLLKQGDGTIVPRVRLRWATPTNPYLSYYELQVDRSSTSPTEWVDCPVVVAPATQGFLLPVKEGEVVNARVRAVTTVGNRGAWSYLYGHTVVGKTEAPADVVNAVAFQNGDVVVFGADKQTDTDLDYIEVRWLDYGDTDWGNGVSVANILRGQQLPSASIPQGTWTFLFKAVDTSGNYSANAVRADLTVTADGYTSIVNREDATNWVGELNGFIVSVSGALVPLSSLAASAHTKAELFAQYVPYPVTTSTYTAPEIDKTLDASARVYADIVSELGRGVSTGQASPEHHADFDGASEDFDGYETWNIGNKTFRYLRSRISMTNSVGRIKITGFNTRIDGRTRTEDGTYTTTGGGSVAVGFASPFHAAPGLVVSPQGSGDVSASYSALDGNGFTGYFKSGGAAAAGTASYKATGA